MRRIVRVPIAILAFFVSSSLFAAGHDLTPSQPTANQMLPVVTGSGSGFTAAWYEPAFSRYRVVSSVVNANGERVEDAIATADQPPVSSLAIAHSPSETLVVWTADDKVFAERLSPSGGTLSTTLVTFGNGYVSNVAVAWDGSRYFVVWSSGVQLIGAFVAIDGSSTTPRPFFNEPSLYGHGPDEFAVAPDMAWNGQHFIVVFAELPNRICSILCPVPDPDRFRVMRVSADGDAIDSTPVVIAGSHLRAHVASNGAQSLIALDSFHDVSTIIAHTEGGLTLEAETPVFRWFSDIASDVAWDGAAFTIGWRYAGADASWIGAAHVTRSGLPFDYRFATAGALPSVWWGRPSIAVNEAGATAFAASDAVGPSSLARARLYLASELAPMPPPPAAPRNVVSYFGGNMARIDWQSDSAAGFVIETWLAYNNTWYLSGTARGDARTITINAAVGSLVRVRAFGPGGFSEGTITSIGSMQRRRAARP
jgi:hypothetical protein